MTAPVVAMANSVRLRASTALAAGLLTGFASAATAGECTGPMINSGARYRIDDNHQIDFHLGLGLDHNAPAYIVGVGYSFRIDGVFRRGG